jgi:hypothetical protein
MIRILEKTERAQEQHSYGLEYIKKEFQNSTHVNLDDFKYLGLELCDLVERILKNNDEKIQRMMESYGLVQMQENTSEDNFDLDKESVKKIILKEISIGQIFYPSDISDEYNLDLKMVMDVMSELKENKQIVENTE